MSQEGPLEMDIFLKSLQLNKQSNVVVYVKCLDLAAVKWVGFFPQPSLFSQEHSYLCVRCRLAGDAQGKQGQRESTATP